MAWNRPSSGSEINRSPTKGGRAGLIVFAAVVLAGIGAISFYFFAGDRSTPSKEIGRQKSTQIKEVAPSLPTKTNVVEKPKTEAERIFAETNGMSIGALRQWEFKNWKGPVYTNGANRVKSLEERTFARGSDRLIAGLLTIEPGESIIGDSKLMFNSYFLKNFKKSLEEPIVIEKDDTDEVRNLKKAVIETRKELKERLDAGEDICELLASTRDEFKQLGLYRQEVEQMVKTAIADNDFSDADVKDCVDAANKMLEDRGAKPLKMPTVYARMLKMKHLKAENQIKKEGK